MSRDLLIAVSPGELRAALTEAGRAVELRIDRPHEGSRIGEIHLGRIVRLLPAMPAALVEIGLERPAMLSGEDAGDLIPPDRRPAGIAALTEGAAALVQITRDPQGEKAAGLTARLRLAGRLLALTPRRAGLVLPGGAAPDARERLAAALADGLPAGAGLVVTKAGLEAAPTALRHELAALAARWARLCEGARVATPPALLEAAEEPLGRILAAFAEPPPDRILVDDRAAFAAARLWLARHRPELAPRLAAATGPADLFEQHGVAGELAQAAAPRVALPGGGALYLETTAAMTVIDVDGGERVTGRGGARAAILAANLAAAAEAARQIRLRNLAGAIVIDFISMERRRDDRGRVLEALAHALAGDPASPELLGWTRLGHVELTRRRRHKPLAEMLCERNADGGLVASAATIACAALRQAARDGAAAPGLRPRLVLHPEIAAALAGPLAPALRALEASLARPVAVAVDPARPRETFDIRPA